MITHWRDKCVLINRMILYHAVRLIVGFYLCIIIASLSVAAGGSIPHSFQNAQKQQYLTNYMWCVSTLNNDDVFDIALSLINFFSFYVAIGKLRVEEGVGQPLTSRPT